MIKFYFNVIGSGFFPLDMLRYDCCWPRDTSDAAAILRDERRIINLVTASDYSPHPERWESFGWKVENGVHDE